ncbi:prolyl oligopeptidase family protein [Aeromonas media]|uniref:prolyl oligopeptidase family serine peptidase n=1 Tax=Aeromonas media TaxID=651 RepID=UPI001BCD979D|nr:prolyl oligopeptidase family serine peptidase [Aeromonas media]MBS4700253.1 S9 family peptidase [Aeromonas media]
MRAIVSLLALSLLSGCSGQPTKEDAMSGKARLHYPATRQSEQVDHYFGQAVADPYRWLEDDRSPETEAWVKAQNAVTQEYLARITFRAAIKEKLASSWNYAKEGAPFREGRYHYFFKNDGLQNQNVLWRQLPGKPAEVFLDPNCLSPDGTTALDQLSFSRDGRILAYSLSLAGSDWREIHLMDVESKEPLEAPLKDVKFSGISWLGNEGFFYSSYDKPDGSELSAKTDLHKLYFHRLGTAQQDDRLVFGAIPAQHHRYVGASVTEDDRFLLISAANSTSGNRLYVKDLGQENAPLLTVQGDLEADVSLVDNRGSTLYLLTNRDAPNRRLVRVEADNPGPEHWRDLIPERQQVLRVHSGSGYLFAEYMVDATARVEQFDYEGKLVREVVLPGLGSVSGFGGKQDDPALYFGFENYAQPPTLYQFEPKSGAISLYRASAAPFKPEEYVSEQRFYRSKDGTRVPLIISYRKGLKLDGSNPTILYGYGGFDVSLTPSFSVAVANWLDLGGVYAVANLRGGGEYGQAWHLAGTQMNKQKVFDDFIAAAEYLKAEGYTSSDRLAVRGGSNGGLLVGAVMTQRPDLMRVALPAVGVLDMLRYHSFTAGAGWAYDYGTSADSEAMFDYLKSYSPLHQVRPGVSYPSTLVTTADHDDRVVPAHSFKFAATLQADDAGPHPQLIRIETNAGHGAGTPVAKLIEQSADIYAFTLYEMGYRQLPTIQ